MFSYRVSSLIGNKESSPTGWYKIPVPPRVDTATLPNLDMVEKNNDSVVIVVNNNHKNRRCEVRHSNNNEEVYNIDDKIEEYQIKTDDEEVSVSGDDILDGRVTINDVVDGGVVKGRVRYAGYTHYWSHWAEIQHPVSRNITQTRVI